MAGTPQPQTVVPPTSGPAKPSARANAPACTGLAMAAGSSSLSRKATVRHSRAGAVMPPNPPGGSERGAKGSPYYGGSLS